MVLEPASGAPRAAHDVLRSPSRASPQGAGGPQRDHGEGNVRRDRLPPRRQYVRRHSRERSHRADRASTTEAMLKQPGAKPFDLAGARAMAGWLLVAPPGYRTDAALHTW